LGRRQQAQRAGSCWLPQQQQQQQLLPQQRQEALCSSSSSKCCCWVSLGLLDSAMCYRSRPVTVSI
jgi:hypothetical protein